MRDIAYAATVGGDMGPETALGVVMRAVWGMLYADDACIVSRSPQGIAKMMSVFVEVFGACGICMSPPT